MFLGLSREHRLSATEVDEVFGEGQELRRAGVEREDRAQHRSAQAPLHQLGC